MHVVGALHGILHRHVGNPTKCTTGWSGSSGPLASWALLFPCVLGIGDFFFRGTVGWRRGTQKPSLKYRMLGRHRKHTFQPQMGPPDPQKYENGPLVHNCFPHVVETPMTKRGAHFEKNLCTSGTRNFPWERRKTRWAECDLQGSGFRFFPPFLFLFF